MTLYFNSAAVEVSEPTPVADSIEFQLLASGDSYLSYAEYSEFFPSGSRPTSSDLETAFGEIDARNHVMGRYYPFEFDGQGVRISREGPWQLYAFLLILSLRGTPFRDNQDWKRSDPLFDEVVMHALEGRHAKVLHFGWPPRDGRPTTFPEALQWAAEAMGLSLRSATQKLPTHRQDGGVDVIAWDPYAYGNGGFPVFLVQNTIRQDYSSKPSDVDPRQWRDWIDFGNTPVVGFAVPFVLDADDPWWSQVVSRTTEFMNRHRLMELVATVDPTAWPEWAELCSFVETQLAQVRLEADSSGSSVVPVAARKRKARVPMVAEVAPAAEPDDASPPS